MSPTVGADVLVIGGGFAGTQAALAAAQAGAHVAIASAAGLMAGGSSFGGTTWGVGLVGPRDAADAADLARTVQEVGGGVADEALVRALVGGIPEATRRLEGQGVRLRVPTRAEEGAYVPCFDHQVRRWRGLERDPYRKAVGRALREAGVMDLGALELVDLVRAGGGPAGPLAAHTAGSDVTVSGALLADARTGRVVHVSARAAVLATGGQAGLFGRTLSPSPTAGVGQAVALAHGATLANLEFLQVMPEVVSPVGGVVANERMFGWAHLLDDEVARQLQESARALGRDPRNLLVERAAYGPFSSRMPSHVVDLAITSAGPNGARLRYEGMPEPLPEFVASTLAWLASRGVRPGDELRLAHAAQASNGGVLISTDASVPGVGGLFACGEVAGGMHGADRVGGLSSAGCLVFGQRAGEAAARWAREQASGGAPVEWEPLASPGAAGARGALASALDKSCLVVRDERGLVSALEEVRSRAQRLADSARPTDNGRAAAETTRALWQCRSAEALLASALARQESRGAHYRSDFPEANPAMARPSHVTMEYEKVSVRLG